MSSQKGGTSTKQKSQGSANASTKNEFNKNALNEDGFAIGSIKEDLDEENMVTIENKDNRGQ